MFGNEGSATFGQVRDGMSSTIMAGESLQNHSLPPTSGWVVSPASISGSMTNPDAASVVWGQGKMFGQFAVVDGYGVAGSTSGNATMTYINAPRGTGANASLPVYPGVLSSEHRGGVNVVLGDGSVRFLKTGINTGIYTSLFQIRDGAAVPDSY